MKRYYQMSRSSKDRLQGAEGNRKTGWGSVLTNKGAEPWYQCKGSCESLLMLTKSLMISRHFHNDGAAPWHQDRKPSHEDKVRITRVHGQTGHSCSIAQTRTKAEA